MNFLRYQTLARLSRVSSLSAECSCEGKLRFYSSDSVFTSAAPHKFFKKHTNTNIDLDDDFDNSSSKKSSPKSSQHVKTNNFTKKQYNTEKSNYKNSYNNNNFKSKNFRTKKFTTNTFGNVNSEAYDNRSSNYKSTPYYKYPKPRNNRRRDSYTSVVDIDDYMNKYDETEDLEKQMMDEDFVDKISDLIGKEEEPEDEKTAKAKEIVKPSKKSNKVYKLNYRLKDNLSYQTELVHEKQSAEIEPEDSLDVQSVKNLGIHDESEFVDRKQTIHKIDYQVYHFDPKLTEFPDDDNTDQTEVNARRKAMQTSEGIIEYDLSSDEFNVKKYLKDLTSENIPGPFDKLEEDISDFGPGLGPSFNFASFANKSQLVQEYVKLGVKLYKVEKDQNHMRALLSVDLKEELPIYIQFLHDCGVPANALGDVITENPMILKEDLDDMKTRIRYLRAHDFSVESIARIVTKNPTWLTWATKHIDERLGHFQNEFKLTGSDVRFLATKQPKLITYKFRQIHENTFAVREQMGFSNDETKILLLSKPRLWMNSRKKIVDSFDYLHNTMKLSHLMIVTQAEVLTCRKPRLQNRHEFLVELKKVQYDPKKPNYISPTSVAFGSDVEFCRDVAKTSIDTYNLFLKTR